MGSAARTGNTTRAVLHDRARPEAFAPCQCRLARCTAKYPARCGPDLYPGKPEEAVPIGHITNGVHVPTWLAPQMFRLYDRHFGPAGMTAAGDPRSGKESTKSTTASSGKRTSA